MDRQPPAPLHPLMKVAAGAVIVASAVGVGAMTGLFSHASSEQAASGAAPADNSAAMVAPAAASAPVAAAPAVAAAPVAEAKPAVKHHKPTKVAREEAPSYAQQAPAQSVCYTCGTVESINTVVDPGQASGVGAIGGAAAGGVLGHQMGKGRGKDAMTVVGALAGAFAGNAVEKNVRKSQHYEVSVRMEDGSYQTFNFKEVPPYTSGQRVRTDGGQLSPR